MSVRISPSDISFRSVEVSPTTATSRSPQDSPPFTPVGGHSDQWVVLRRPNEKRRLLKKCTPREANFYLLLSYACEVEGHKDEVEFCQVGSDKFQRLVEAGDLQRLVLLSNFVPSFFNVSVTPDEDCRYSVELADLCDGYKYPCVMDIKMGTKLYDDFASDEKKEKMRQKAEESTSAKYGLRITGMCGTHYTGKNITIDRHSAKKFTQPEEIRNALGIYLSLRGASHTQSLSAHLRSKLSDILDWFTSNQLMSFHSSSLLFIYDSDAESEANVQVKMIDFAHVCEAKVVDEGYIQGLKFLSQSILLSG